MSATKDSAGNKLAIRSAVRWTGGVDERARIAEREAPVAGTLDERGRRAVAAAEALAWGRGGIAAVARATGLAPQTIRDGGKEWRGAGPAAAPGRVRRRAGGGREKTAGRDPTVVADLERLVEPATRGDPESPLRWTSKSVRALAAARGEWGHRVSHQWVAAALRALGHRLQGARKTREGGDRPARDARFARLNAAAAGEPAIAVDTKKQALVGDFKDGGREWRPQGEPEEGRVQDFVIPEPGRVRPSGVAALAANAGRVSGGIDHDTATGAVATIRRWWPGPGRARSPGARQLLLTAAGGGSNGARGRRRRWERQRRADATGLASRVCHLPPGTSKWHTSEHRRFASSSQHWRGRPLVS